MKLYLNILCYTVIVGSVVANGGLLLSTIFLHGYNPVLGLVFAPPLALIGWLWLKGELAELRQRVGHEATAFGYNAGYQDCYHADEDTREKAMLIITLDEQMKEKAK